MLAHTHGQPATPTTMGKEFAVFVARLRAPGRAGGGHRLLGQVQRGDRHVRGARWPRTRRQDWADHLAASSSSSLGLTWNPLTTQIESHDWQAELYSKVSHTNRVLHNLCTDMWAYISMGYFTQIPPAGSTGSSTMPHKINPIRFENAEANLELSSAILELLATDPGHLTAAA